MLHAVRQCCKEAFSADPTETALLNCCNTLLPGQKTLTQLSELPFDSRRYRRTR